MLGSIDIAGTIDNTRNETAFDSVITFYYLIANVFKDVDSS